MYVKFVKSILRDTSEYSGMMGAIKHFFCDSEDGLKTGGKAKPQNKISLLIKRGEDIIAEFTDNTMNINGGWGSEELTSREAEGRGGKKTQHETLQNEVAHVHSIVSHPSEAHGCGGAHKFCIESALQCGTSILSHDSGMNQIHMGALSIPNLLFKKKKNNPQNIPVSCKSYKIKPNSSEL